MTDYYETDEQLGQYMDFHYGPEHFGVPNFPETCAERCLAVKPRGERALDLGCATGRSTFELARGFDHVLGLDLSQRFIDAAEQLRSAGELSYRLTDEGEISHEETASLNALGLSETAGRIRFEVADAGNLPDELSGYDLIFAGNLIDRMPNPGTFLQDIHQRLNPGGVLVVTSPYTLLPDFTPRAHWIGGYYDSHGEPVTVLDGMKERLHPHLELIQKPEDVPFVIRETRRKHQHTLAQLTVWGEGV